MKMPNLTPFIAASVAFFALLQAPFSQAAIITSAVDPIAGGQLNFGNSQGTFVVGEAGTALGVNNWPAGMSPFEVLDPDGDSRYVNFAKTNTGVVLTPAAGKSIARQINFDAANDSGSANPATFSLYGSNLATVSGTETSASSFSLDTFIPIVLNRPTGFFQFDPSSGTVFRSTSISFTNEIPYQTYLLVFPTLIDSSTADSMQIDRIQLGGAIVIPEPGTLSLIGLGALGAAGLRRRRKEAHQF